jgi:pimeloyl-ACP methyl ester carboxylesterase
VSTYVLVHGAWHGSWCWDRIVPLLEEKGHRVEAHDLPGHGRDTTPVSEISTAAYIDSVCKILDAQSEPVILVGHSLAGLIVSQAAEYRPDKIKTLVYIAALLLHNGESPLNVPDTDSLLGPNMIAAEDGSVTIRDEVIIEAWYSDCRDEDAAWAKSLLVPQNPATFTTPINITEENFGRIPRVYIECLLDKALSPWVQKKMYSEIPCRVISMNTNHSPFLSAPEEFVEHLLSL